MNRPALLGAGFLFEFIAKKCYNFLNKQKGESTVQQPFRLPGFGMRSAKTALSATLLAAVYYLFDRNPTFACIGAVFGMGSDLEDSWKHGGNRLIGTIIGGFIGLFAFWMEHQFSRAAIICCAYFCFSWALCFLSIFR